MSSSVLVVDDQTITRQAVCSYLERHGFAVRGAEDGQQALGLLEAQPPDLVLLDLSLPDLHGLEILERIRQLHNPLELPVVILSASDGAPDIVVALERGANDYVVKPPDFPVLLARVKKELSMSQSQSRQEGDRFGPYRLLNQLGEGNSGIVYEAVDTRFDRRVALKVLRHLAGPPEQVRRKLSRFWNEARSIGRLRHPNIVQIHTVGSRPRCHIVMERVEGTSLKQLLLEEGPLPLDRAGRIAVQLLDALATVHRAGIVHRDLSPSNLLIDGQDRLCLLDFGLAKLRDSDGPTFTGEVLGTPSYMAPEQIDPELGPADRPVDLYAAGAILFEMMTGRPPFVGETIPAVLYALLHDPPPRLRELRPECPAGLERVLERALAKDPLARYQRAEDLLHDFRLESEGIGLAPAH